MRSLGLDVGEKRIGVALSDPEGIMAIPLTAIQRESDTADIQAILNLVEQHGVERIVVGLPRSLNGSIGLQAEKIMAFSDMLRQEVEIPVEDWDERFSTVAAERLLIEAKVRGAKRKKHRDAIAASLILQGYLDHLRSKSL
jgi:putative Holliday junction resolvase